MRPSWWRFYVLRHVISGIWWWSRYDTVVRFSFCLMMLSSRGFLLWIGRLLLRFCFSDLGKNSIFGRANLYYLICFAIGTFFSCFCSFEVNGHCGGDSEDSVRFTFDVVRDKVFERERGPRTYEISLLVVDFSCWMCWTNSFFE